MYYLLGYRLLGQCEDRLNALYKRIEEDPLRKKYKKHIGQNEELHIYFKDVLGPKLLIEVLHADKFFKTTCNLPVCL
jgi:hypothetical protein